MKKYLGKIKYVILTTLIVLFLFTTVAYSGLASKLAITSEVMFRALADIRVTNIKLEKTTGNALESYEPKYNVDATTTGFELPSEDSSITYRVTVTNRGKRNQTIYEFIKNSINADGVNIKIEGYTEKDIIPYESSIDFLITFTTTNPSNQTINVIEKYDFREVYTIEYDANGGTNAPKEQIKYQKEDIALREEIPTRETYKFVGWSETQGSETAEYKAGGAYTLDKDVILYAVWQKNAAKIDLNYNVDGTWYYSGYNNRIQTGIKVNGEDKGYLNDFGETYDYGTSYEIYGFKLDGEEMPYSKKYTVDGTNHLGIYFNTMNFTVNDESLGSISHEQLIVIPGTTYTVTNSTITMSDGRIVTASPKTVTGYTTKFTGYTITPNSTTINAKTTVKANFTKEANTYKVTLDNKSATTAGTTTIYEKYNTGIYLDSELKTTMTTSANPITKPVKTGYTFKGYYTKENGQGDQIINADGYITEVITNTTYTANTTLYAYYADEEKPTLTLTNSSNENWTNKDVTITLNGADSGSGIKEYQWKENGAWTTRAVSITNGVGSITYTVDRNLEIEFRVIDNAGNISDVKKTYVRRDTVAPKIELNGTASSSEINNSNSVTIPIKITETTSGMNSTEFTASDISVLINGTAVNPSTKTLTYNSVSNGVYSYTLTLSGITLNGKVTLEIASGAVKDSATNSNIKTTLDPSVNVSNAYTISLNGNGATKTGTTVIYEKYNTGIYLDSTLNNGMTTSANPITKPEKSYTVSFDANGTEVTAPSAITKNYSYSGYYTDASNGTQMINENGYVTSSFKNTSYASNGTLYAHWGTKPSVTIPSVSKTGYTCSWNTSKDGKGTTYNGGDVTDKLNTQTLYARCSANTYTIEYKANGGSGTMNSTNAIFDQVVTISKNTFTKEGYTFVGWTTKSDGTDDKYGWTNWSGTWKYVNGQYGILSNKLVLYAMWTPITYSITYNLNGGTLSKANPTSYNITTDTFTLKNPSKTGYTFAGWTGSNGTTAQTSVSIALGSTGNKTYTANYTPNTNTAYKVNHYVQEVGKETYTLNSTDSKTGTTDSSVTLSDLKKDITGFKYSKGQVGGVDATTTTILADGSRVINLYYTRNSYTVTYDATTNGGSTAKQTASTLYGASIDLTKKAEKSGYEFVGWNTNKDAISALTSYNMPASNVTLYAIYKKTLTATFNYYNSQVNKQYVTIYNNATSGSVTSPAALGTPSGYTFRHYSTSNAANASKTVGTNEAIVLTSNATYYASYQKNVTVNFYYHSGTDTYANKQTSTTASGVQYLAYNGSVVNSNITVPTAVTNSTGYYGTTYKGVSNKVNSSTASAVNTGSTSYYAFYQVGITYYYYNGSTHTNSTATRSAYSNGTNYVASVNVEPTPSSYDGAAYKGWSYTNDSVNYRTPTTTAMTALYAVYQKEVTATFNYYGGSTTSSNTRTYISKNGGINTYNTNITIPDAAKANSGSYTYRGISTSNAANASLVTPTTASTTYYTSYTYAITVNFTANGGTGTAPSAVAGTGYMNYSGSKIGINVTMPNNTFTKTGYSFGGWYDSIAKKTSNAGTSYVIDSTRSLNAVWNANELTFNDEEKEITYSEASQSFNISKAAGNGTGKYSYSITSGDTNGNFIIDGLTISTNKDKVPSVGTYKLGVTAKDENSLKTKEATITIIVKNATITYTASSYEGFYDGSGHTIGVNVTKPTSGATITYSTSSNGTYSSTKPTVTNATTTPVTIYFKISAANYNTITDSRTVTINKTNSVSPTLTKYSGTYDGQSHTIGVSGGNGGTIKYSTDQKTWSTTIPKRTDVGTTTVYVKVVGDGNHTDSSVTSATIKIDQKKDVINISSVSTKYTGKPITASATAESKTTITYTYYNGTTCSGTALSTAPVNVGDYSVKATSAGNTNYKSNSACATIKISNTNNPTMVTAVTGLKYGSTSNLLTTSNVQGTIYYSVGTELTSSNYKTSGSTNIPTASGKNAGTYKIYYYVDGTGTNYQSTKGGPVNVTIGKAAGSISYATKNVSKNYGSASFINVLTKIGDGNVSYSSSNTGVATIDNSGNVTIKSGGTTTITATVTDGTNYTYATKTATYTLTVNQIDNTAKVSPVTGIIYGDTKSMVSVSGVQGTIYYSVGTEITEANYLSIGSTTIPASTGRNAGDYNIYYFVKGNSNYKNTSGSVKVTISAKTLSIPGSPNPKTYNGNSQGSGIACPTGSTAGGTISATDAGTYTQTCTLNSTINYVWNDTNKTTTPKSIGWKINPKSVAVTWGSTTSFTYNGSGQAPSASATTGITNETMAVTRTTGTNAGSYTSTASCSSVTGGRAKCGNYTLTGNTKSFSIGRATMTVPSSPSGKNYNGSAQGSGITCPTGSTAGGTTSATNQGTYTQTCIPDRNHKWSDGTTTAKSITWVINKVSATINCSNKTYNGESQTACSCSGGTIGGTPSAIDAGTYTVSCTPDGNHTAPSNKTWKINPKSVAVTWGSTTSFTYNGSGQAPSASATTGITNETMAVTRTTGTNAGSYTSTASCSSVTGGRAKCGNYTLTGNTKSFSIGKRNTTCTTASASKDYNGTALTANSGTCTNLISGHSATVSASGTITNVGSTANTYKSTAIKSGSTDVTGNYNITGANGTLTINKVPAQNPTLTKYSGTYDGQSHTIGVSGGSGGTIQYSTDQKTWSTTKPSRTDAGTTTVYVKVVGDGNHTNSSIISSTITISPAILSAPTNIKITTAGIVTWDSVSNATKYQISIDGTNWTDATSGVDYLSKIIASTGTRTVYVRAVGTGNYSTSNSGSASVTVYTVSFSSSSTTMGTVDTSSYNVINGTTYSANSNKLLFNGITTGTTTKTLKTVTASPKSNYAFNSWSSNSGSISSNITLTAYFRGADYTISLNNNGASTAGTSAIYQRYATGIYLDSAGSDTKIMSSTSNPISVPSKPTYRIHYKNKEVSTAEFSPKFNGYFTASSSGTQLINSSGYITSNFTNTYFSSNATLYARWDHNYTLSTISQTGYTCSWNTKFDGTGTKYNSGATASITANTTLYAICTANSYTVKFEPNGGSVATTSKSVTFDSDYGTLPTPTRADSTDSKTGKTISYAFEGWYTAANGGTKVTDTSLVSTASDHSLYAHWISKPIITGGSADWFNKEVDIKLEVPSTSDTDSVIYQYYVSTSNTDQVGGEWKSSSDSGVAPVSSNGIHYVFYRAMNFQEYNKYINNDEYQPITSPISNFQTVKIDTQGPINLTVNNPKNNVWSTSDVTVTLSATDTGSGVKEFQWYENDAWTTRALTTNGNSATITFGAERNTTIRFRAVDNVGNASSEVTTIVKIDKTTPTAPVLTGGSSSWTTACGTISIQTAGTTGPSGIKNYEVELENMLNGGSVPASYNQFTYKDNGNWQTTGNDPYVRYDDLGNVYMTHARVSFASATPVAMTLQVFYWTEGSGPTETNSSTVDVPAGTKGYVDVQIKAGTYDGLRFDFGNTTNVTYQIQFWGYVNKFTKPTLNSDGTYNYSTTVCNRGLNRVRYRTVANNNLVSNWSNYDTNDGSKVLIDNPAVYDVNTSAKYSTVQKAVNLLQGKGGAYLALLRDTVENVTIPSGTNYSIELGNHYIHGYIKNYGTVALGNGYVTGYYVNQNNAFINYGTAYINGNVTIMGGDTAIISSGGAINISGTNNTIRGIKGYAINMDAGTITVNSGTTVYSDTTTTVNVNAGTFNVNGGTIKGRAGTSIGSYSGSTINVLAGEVFSNTNSGIYSRGTLNINGGKIYSNQAGKNGVFVYSGTAKMTGGEVFNTVDDSSCGGALTLASTSTNGFTMTGGYIHGCVGINQQANATGNINISGDSTNVVGDHTGIRINNVNSSTLLIIGLTSNNTVYPFIGSNGNYYAIEILSSNTNFVMVGGRLRSYGKTKVYKGVNIAKNYLPQLATQLKGKTFDAVSSGTGYYDAWWH